MKFLLVLAVALSSQAFAKDYALKCLATYNAQTVVESEVTLIQNQSNLAFGEFEDFKFLVTSKASDVVELQILDTFEPSRTYATAKLNAVGSFVELSVWKRDLLLEVRCTL